MRYEIGPDGFIRRVPDGAQEQPVRHTRPEPTPSPRVRQYRTAERAGLGCVALFGIVILALIAIRTVGCIWSFATSHSGNTTPAQSPATPTFSGFSSDAPVSSQPEWPTDSPDMAPAGYIQALNAHVQSLSFFASGSVPPALDRREYYTSFRSESGQFIYWQLNLTLPTRQERQAYLVVSYLYGSDGSLVSKERTSSYVDPAWTTAATWGHWEAAAPSLSAGVYRVSLFVDGVKIAAGSFTINSAPEEPKDSAQAQPEQNSPLSSNEKADDKNPAYRIPYSPTTQSNQKHETTTAVQTVDALLVHKTVPVYPPLARQARIEGVVELTATVGTDGKLHDIQAISGNLILRKSAIDAVTQWIYAPATVDDNPVETRVSISINYVLDR